MKNRIILIILTLACLILVVFLLFSRQSRNLPTRYDRNLFIGKWTGDYNLELKTDSSFTFRCNGSSQNFFGIWSLSDIYFNNNDTVTFLILKNLKRPQYMNEYWFSNYFFEIKSITSKDIDVIDLSASLTVRRNNSYRLLKE